MEELARRIEYEVRFGNLKVDGDYLLKWYNENPEKKKQRIEDFFKFRDAVVTDAYILNDFKNSMLFSIEQQVNNLNGICKQEQKQQQPENWLSKYAPLISFGIAAVLGVVLDLVGGGLIEKYQQNEREWKEKYIRDLVKEVGVIQ